MDPDVYHQAKNARVDGEGPGLHLPQDRSRGHLAAALHAALRLPGGVPENLRAVRDAAPVRAPQARHERLRAGPGRLPPGHGEHVPVQRGRTVFQQYNYTNSQPSRTYKEGRDGHGDQPPGLYPTAPGPTNIRMLADTGYAGPKHAYTHTFQAYREELPPPPQPPAKHVRFPTEPIPPGRPPHVRHKLAAALDVRDPIPTLFATES